MTYFPLYIDDIDLLEELSDEDTGKIIKALLRYADTGERADFQGELRIVFKILAKGYDRATKAYEEVREKNQNNGKKGGRPPKEKETEETQENPKNPAVILETQKTQRFSEKPKKPSGYFKNPKNPREEKRIEENRIEENRSDEKLGNATRADISNKSTEELIADTKALAKEMEELAKRKRVEMRVDETTDIIRS